LCLGTILLGVRFIARPGAFSPFRNRFTWVRNIEEEIQMSSTTDKIKGLANEAAGNIKQVAGKAVGNHELHAEGIVQERKGEAQQAVGKVKDAVKQVVDKA
jgi:uncharacterized protein YjbJ (UPF0337 family)